MKNINDIAFVAQARLSSERAPRKMIKSFNGTSLVEILCDKILLSKTIPLSNFYLSVYDDELKKIALDRGLNVYARSEESALSEGPMQQVMEWHNKLPYKYVVMISACHPFLSVKTIDGFVDHYIKTESEGLFGVIENKNYF